MFIGQLCITGFVLLTVDIGCAAEDPKGDIKAAEANLRKAQEAIKNTDSGLKLLSRTLYVGSVLAKNPELKELSKFSEELRKPTGELKKHADKIVELAEKQKDKKAAEKEGKTLVDKIKAVKIADQAKELEQLANKVRELPIGLVSENVDEKFVVSADLLVKNPKQAEARFKAYLTAMKTNAEYLKLKQGQLGDAAKVAKSANAFLSKLQLEIERAVPFSGPYAKQLTGFYLEVDNLAKAYNKLASDSETKAKQAKRAAEVELKRHSNLEKSLNLLF